MPQIPVNKIHLEYESFGDARAPVMLLIMGLGAQMIHWPDELCEALAQGGFRVIRYDNRDAGLSAKLDHLGKPKVLRAGLADLFRLPVRAPYTLHDMADDALHLLDALKIKSAHIVGASMGGMIGQILAATHPKRVRSFTCIMSTSGARGLPKAHWKLQLRLARRPTKLDRASMIEHSMQTWRIIGSPGYAIDDALLRQRVTRAYDRGFHPRGAARQLVAIIAGGSRKPLLSTIKAPTLVIHGEHDPLVPVAAAHHLAKHIAGARLEIIPGMGHDLPPALVGKLAKMIVRHASNHS